MLNTEIIVKINKLIAWTEKEGDSDGYQVNNPIDALANLRYSLRIINEFDGKPNSFKKSTAQAVGDLSTLLLSIPSNLASAANLHPSFTLRASDEGWDQADKYETTQYQEIWQIVGLEAICGKYMLYHRELHGYKARPDRSPYSGRILRLTDADYERIFW